MGVENNIIWSEIGSGFGEPGGTPLPRFPRSTPRGRGGGGAAPCKRLQAGYSHTSVAFDWTYHFSHTWKNIVCDSDWTYHYLTLAKDRSLLWLDGTHLRLKTYDIAFQWVYLNMCVQYSLRSKSFRASLSWNLGREQKRVTLSWPKRVCRVLSSTSTLLNKNIHYNRLARKIAIANLGGPVKRKSWMAHRVRPLEKKSKFLVPSPGPYLQAYHH